MFLSEILQEADIHLLEGIPVDINLHIPENVALHHADAG